jgi:phosphopentomutase
MPVMRRVILIVLDSAGIGALPDAPAYSDEGANTLGNLYLARGHLKVPNLSLLGLGNLVDIGAVPAEPIGGYGKMAERSASKDTTIGHWEIAGVMVDRPFPTYPDGFPQTLIAEFETLIGDIFCHRGLTEEIHTRDNMDGVDKTIASMHKYQHQSGLIFANLVDFDMVYGQSFKKDIIDECL